jgi:hypothetical protein
MRRYGGGVSSARAAAGDGRRIDALDLGGELAGDVGELAERPRHRAQGHTFEGLAEVRDRPIEALPQVSRTTARSRAWAERVGEPHVAATRIGSLTEPEAVCVAQRRRLLLRGVRDRPHPLCKAEVRRRRRAREAGRAAGGGSAR